MSSMTQRRYGGVGAEDRRADRRARLIAAGLDLLGTTGAAGTTVRGVAERARLTPRYFYESFPDTDALIVAVFDQVIAEVEEVCVAALAEAPRRTRSQVRAVVAATFAFFAADPRKGRVALVEALGHPVLTERRLEVARTSASLLGQRSRRFYPPGETTDRALEFTARFVIGGFAETLTAWFQGALSSSQEELIDDCTEMFLAAGKAVDRLTR